MAEFPSDITNASELARRHQQAGRLLQAEQLYRSILEADPNNGEASHFLGLLAYRRGESAVAVQLLAKAVLANPSQPVWLNNLGLALQAERRPEEALLVYRQAISIDPGLADAHFNSGVVLAAQGESELALSSYEQAIANDANHADAHNGAGLVHLARGRLERALSSFDRALALDPQFAEAHNNRGNVLQAQGRIPDALAAYRHALAVDPDFAGAHSNLLLCLHYDADSNAEALFSAHREWNTRHTTRLTSKAPHHANTIERTRRLRIGYVSADFCAHPVANFIQPLLSTHDRAAFDVFCYSNVACPDETTQRLRSLADTWRTIRGLADEPVARMIADDAIDILVDLSGHTAGNRLMVFARKPAPVQVTYLGYPGTSGLPAMDYRLTDEWLDPPELTDTLYSETLLRLPGGSLCFQAPFSDAGTSVSSEPAGDGVTFASFNNAAKISPAAVALWSRVLLSVPSSRLLLKSRSFGDRQTVESFAKQFERHGITPDRLEFIGWLPSRRDHFALYERAHIALDTFPYSGCTTTCDALWMGVPVVTLARPEPRSRMSLSVLHQIGKVEWIAHSHDEYVAIARRLAMDVGELRATRSVLRERLMGSSLLEAAGFTRCVEKAYRAMWQAYVDRH